jgi:hypothetical protein
MDDHLRLTTIFHLLRQKQNFYLAVKWRAFPRHASVLGFFILSAWTLDPADALTYAAGIWLILRVLRRPLWQARIHEREIWPALFFVHSVLARWPLILVCILIFWWRSPESSYDDWLLFALVLSFEVISTLVFEARGYRDATRTIQELEYDLNQIRERYNTNETA